MIELTPVKSNVLNPSCSLFDTDHQSRIHCVLLNISHTRAEVNVGESDYSYDANFTSTTTGVPLCGLCLCT